MPRSTTYSEFEISQFAAADKGVSRQSCAIVGPGPGGGPVHVPGDGNPGPGRDPSDGHVQTGRDLRPSNPQKTYLLHNEVPPSELSRTAVESSNLHATCSAFSPHTSNRLPTRPRGRAVAVQRKPHGAAGAGQF